MTARLKKCNEEIASGRFRKATQFLDVAEMVRDLANDESDVGDDLLRSIRSLRTGRGSPSSNR